jgi:hypothetical protein
METYIINTLAIWGVFLWCVASFAVPVSCAAETSRRGHPWRVVVTVGILAVFCWPLIFVWLVVRSRRATKQVGAAR